MNVFPFNIYPYQDYNAFNLDWIVKRITKLDASYAAFVSENTLKFADPFEWSRSSAYDPNTVVRSGDHVYLAKQYVPANLVNPTNTDYWIDLGDIGGFVQAINAMDTRMTTAETNITDLKKLPKFPFEDYKNSYVICFGDSNTDPNTSYGNWFETFCAYLHPKGHKSYGVSGATIQNNIGTYPAISAQITGANDFPADEVSLVLMMGGINDFHYGTYDNGAFGAAVKNTVQMIHQKFKNALIVTMMDCGHQLPNGRMLQYNEAMNRNTAVVGSGVKGCFVSMADLSLQNNIWDNQNHYSTTGAYAIAARLINALFGFGTGYNPAPRRTRTFYTAGSPGMNGAYNFGVDVVTTIDPVLLVRRDRITLYTATDFNAGTNPGDGIVELPGWYSPAYIVRSRSYDAEARYLPMSMLRSSGSYTNVITITNLTPNNAGDSGHDEPRMIIALPYYNSETWSNARGHMELETVITWNDTQGGN